MTTPKKAEASISRCLFQVWMRAAGAQAPCLGSEDWRPGVVGRPLMVIDYANEAAWGMQMGGSGRDSLAGCSHLLAPRLLMAELGLPEAPQHIHGVLKKLCGQNPDEVIAKQTRFFQAPANPPHSTASFLASFLQRSGG